MGARRKVGIHRARRVIAANINALVDARFPEAQGRPEALAKFLGFSRSQAQRLLSGAHGFTLETLGHVADRFGLELWQLHVPELDPKNPPRLLPNGKPRPKGRHHPIRR